MSKLAGRYPAIVKSYDKVTRLCRVDIPPLTSSADLYPLAEIEYSIGDTDQTDIEILAGDKVWVAFIGGNSRYPIITGYRNKQTGNTADLRRWHQQNIELSATNNLDIKSSTSLIEVTQSLTLKCGSNTIVIDTSGITLNGSAINLN